MNGKKSNIIKKKLNHIIFFVWKLERENKRMENKSLTFFFYTQKFDFPCFIKEKIKVIQNG